MTFPSVRHAVALRGGTMLLRREWWRPAAFLLRRVTKRAPEHWEAHNNLAIALLKLKRWEEAAGMARRAIDLNPTAVESHDLLGIALLQLERWGEAVAAYRRALAVDPTRYVLYDRLGMALWRLERWGEVAETYEAALKLDAGQYGAHYRLGVAREKLGQWAPAAAALRRAIALAADDPAAAGQLPGMKIHLVNATDQLSPTDDSSAAGLLRQAESLDPGAAARLSRGIELLELGRWSEAVAHLSAPGPHLGALDFLCVDPLVRLGRLSEAVAAHRRAVAANGLRPPLPRVPAAERFSERQTRFWTVENLGADVFAVARWLEESAALPERVPDGPRLLFVLDNDFGELTTVQYFLLGQALAARATLLLPEPLYAQNAQALPVHAQSYGTVDDVLQAVDREQSEIVFLCAGYLFCPHLEFTPDDLARLIAGLRERGCRVVTADPFLGVLSRQDPRTVIRFEVTSERIRNMAVSAGFPTAADEMIKSRRDAEERTWTSFTRSERILRDTYHLYPSYCDRDPHDVAETDARNLAFFNDRLLRPAPTGVARPHWLFILSTADCEIQWLLEGKTGFADIVAGRLVETLAAGRHPILIGPRAFVDQLISRMPTAEGIDILAHQPFAHFMSLLLAAEQVFYWNAVSHSLLIRLYNQLPIVLFDRGHLIRTAPAIHDRIVRWYYQGWTPPVRDHHAALSLETVEQWAAEYRREAGALVERFRRAPSPEEMVADLMRQAPTAGLEAGVASR